MQIDLAWPWYTYEAVLYVAARVRSDMRVFEWGCGYSTAYFQKHCASVISIEHDKGWCDRVRQALKSDVRHVSPEYEGPCVDPADPHGYFSGRTSEWFSAYAQAIAAEEGLFDLISVDGRARPACLRLAIPKVAPGGFLVLDNSDRERYAQAMALVPKDWECVHFEGWGRVTSEKAARVLSEAKSWRTTIWTCPGQEQA